MFSYTFAAQIKESSNKMKKSFLTFAALVMVLSFTSCKETPAETTTETEAIETETEVLEEEVSEEIIVEDVDSLSTEATEVEEEVTETPAI